MPDVLEVSYASRSDFTFRPNTEIFPTGLDRPCKPGEPDLFLGTFAFDFATPAEALDAATLAKLLTQRLKKAFLARAFKINSL